MKEARARCSWPHGAPSFGLRPFLIGDRACSARKSQSVVRSASLSRISHSHTTSTSHPIVSSAAMCYAGGLLPSIYERCFDGYQFSRSAATVTSGALPETPDFGFTPRIDAILGVAEVGNCILFGAVWGFLRPLSTCALLDRRNVNSTFSTARTLNNRAKLADAGLASSCA